MTTPTTYTSISIQKVITVINEKTNSIYRIKSSEFAAEIQKHEIIHTQGWCSVGKFKRYHDQLIAAGFKVIETWNNELTDDNTCIDFSIFYTK